jgi:hypothetical protein
VQVVGLAIAAHHQANPAEHLGIKGLEQAMDVGPALLRAATEQLERCFFSASRRRR